MGMRSIFHYQKVMRIGILQIWDALLFQHQLIGVGLTP